MMLAYEDCQILDVTGPLEILASANDLTPGAPAYDITLVAARAGAFRTTSGLKLVADRAYGALTARDLKGLDTFIVSGGEGTRASIDDAALLGFVGRAAKAAARLASVCSGSAILAAAGLLDGRRATTHWNAAAEMARAFPAVRLEPDAIYVRDGNIWTSAGVTAGMDLAIALIEHDLGREAALAVARRHVLYMTRPGGQTQFSEAAPPPHGARTARALRHIAANLGKDLRMPALAEAAGMSERSLLRAFREELETTPADYVQRARVAEAQRRLTAPRAPAKRIAGLCGFSSAEVMRRAFHRELGVSPADYRARFATTERTPS